MGSIDGSDEPLGLRKSGCRVVISGRSTSIAPRRWSHLVPDSRILLHEASQPGCNILEGKSWAVVPRMQFQHYLVASDDRWERLLWIDRLKKFFLKITEQGIEALLEAVSIGRVGGKSAFLAPGLSAETEKVSH